jgi:hypothetical protein
VTILFHVTLMTMLRHFESVLLALAERGHRVRVALPNRRPDLLPPPALADHPSISFVRAPATRGDRWAHPIHELRSLRDYLRYLDARYDGAPKLRTRALRKMVAAVTREHQSHLAAHCPHCDQRIVDDQVGRMMLAFKKQGRRNLSAMLGLMEATIPSDTSIEAFLTSEAPDVVLVTPLINFGSYQADYVKSAQALGIPVGFPVFSWDNLSNKGLIHVAPDRVFVWNDRQRIEAVKMHRVPPERVVVTGAPRFDDFFLMQPGQSRDAFCAGYALDPKRPIVTYLCSSEFVAGREVAFVERWIAELRSDRTLAACGILIRPHPREQKQWRKFSPPHGVAVAFPRALNSDQTLFDTVYHSAAVVGLNTSAQLEAGILGRPVLTLLAPEFKEGQRGTLHFSYLLKEHGGFVDVAPDYETHRQQLAAAVNGDYDPRVIRNFIEQFLRPQGVDHPATPFMVQAIEEFARVQAPESRPAVTETRS